MVWICPNTLAWAGYRPQGEAQAAVLPQVARALAWRPTIPWSLGLSLTALVSLVYMSRAGEFLYLQF